MNALEFWHIVQYNLKVEIRKYAPNLTNEQIEEGLKTHKIRIIYARGSNWPFGKPAIPPKIVFEEGFLSE